MSNERDNTVSVIDSATFAVTRTFPVGRRPRGVVFSKDGKRLFVCASDSDSVQVFDPDSGKLLTDLPSGEDPEQFALAPMDAPCSSPTRITPPPPSSMSRRGT